MMNRILPVTARQIGKNYARYCSTSEVGSKEYFKDLVEKSSVVVFMKGTPAEPRCGFSNAVVQVMRMHGVDYDAHDVLADDRIRNGVKEFSNWPTIPQVYMDKQFVGGCDILLQMHQSGEFIEELGKIGIKSSLLEDSENKPSDDKP